MTPGQQTAIFHMEKVSWTMGFSEVAEQKWQAGEQMSGVIREIFEFKMSMEF